MTCEKDILNTNQLGILSSLDCTVLLSGFHREQAWERWLSQSSNGVVAHKNAILACLRRVAEAKSEQELEEALELLKHTDYWQCEYGQSFRQWFEEKWLSNKEVEFIF